MPRDRAVPKTGLGRLTRGCRGLLKVDSRCALVSIPTLSKEPLLMSRVCSSKAAQLWAERIAQCLLPSASDPTSRHPCSASQSVARRRPSTSGNVNSLRSLKQPPFCVCKHRIPPRTRSRSNSPRESLSWFQSRPSNPSLRSSNR